MLIEELRAADAFTGKDCPLASSRGTAHGQAWTPQVIWDDLALRNHTGGETEAQQQPVTAQIISLKWDLGQGGVKQKLFPLLC